MALIKIIESNVAGQESTFIEYDTDSFDERYAVQYGGSGITFNGTKEGWKCAVEDYLTNVKHQLESAAKEGGYLA